MGLGAARAAMLPQTQRLKGESRGYGVHVGQPGAALAAEIVSTVDARIGAGGLKTGQRIGLVCAASRSSGAAPAQSAYSRMRNN